MMAHKGMLPKRFFAMLLCVSMAFPVFSQAGLQDEPVMSFRAEGETLLSILQNLSDQHGLNLSYNSSDEKLNSRLTYQAHDKPLLDVLREILALVHYEYTSIGNQLVIHRSERFESLKQDEAVTVGRLSADTILRIVEIPVAIVDTIIIRDTIREVVYRQAAFTPGVRPLIVTRPAFRPAYVRSGRWSLSLAYSQVLAGYGETGALASSEALQDIRAAEGFSFRNFALSGGVHYQAGALMLSSSISLNRYSTPFSYSELFTSGGYHRVDTLDSFYLIVDGEEIWTHITDSTYIPLESSEILYDRMNETGMIEARFTLSYDVFVARNSDFFILGGIQAGIPLWLRGNVVVNKEGYPAVPLTRGEVRKYLFGYHLGAGNRTRLNERLDLVVSVTYKRHTRDLFPSHPLDRRLHGLALQAGIQYHL